MAHIDSDDDFLPPVDAVPSPKRTLKRLKKKSHPKPDAAEPGLDSIAKHTPESSIFSPSSCPANSHPSVFDDPPRRLDYSPLETNVTDPAVATDDVEDDDEEPRKDLALQDIRDRADLGNASDQEEDCAKEMDEDGSEDDSDGEDVDEDDSDVDEDDEKAVLSLLEKKNKSEASEIPADLLAAPIGLPALDVSKSSRKLKSSEREDIHASSQRLLRETPNASFKPQISSGKSVSSVLEKIRLRKLQLAQGNGSTPSTLVPKKKSSLTIQSDLVETQLLSSKSKGDDARDDADVHEVVIENEDDPVITELATEAKNDENTDAIDTPQTKDDVPFAVLKEIGSTFRAPLEDTQDIFSVSEDVENVENNILDLQDDIVQPTARVDLHFDTETQDDFHNWQDEDDNKENRAPNPPHHSVSAYSKGPSVRSFVDDEAEDEDEDILVPGEEEDEDGEDDLADMIVQETNEKECDAEKRAELHRKWLEQQEAETTDDILLKMKSGWRHRGNRKRGFECLDDDDLDNEVRIYPKQSEEANMETETALLDENTQDSEDLKDDGDDDGTQYKSLDDIEDENTGFKDVDNVDDGHESSDDEEHEQRIMRQRFLQESESQGDFMTPAEDETSREVFGMINKVNVGHRNKRQKTGPTDLKILTGGSSNSNTSFSSSKSSFLRRTSSSTLNTVQRQAPSAGSATRSFIFGRDDSNSCQSFDSASMNKENMEPISHGMKKGSLESSRLNQTGKTKSISTKESPAKKLGPSLFDILRRQGTNTENAIQSHSNEVGGNNAISPLFSAFRPMKAQFSRASRAGF